MTNEDLGINVNLGFDKPVRRGWLIFSWLWGGVVTFDPKPS